MYGAFSFKAHHMRCIQLEYFSHILTWKSPSDTPTSAPSSSYQPSSSSAPTFPFVFGESFVTDTDLGLELSSGLSARLIALSGRPVKYSNGKESSRSFHYYIDAAGVVSLPDGGYVYMSNSEDDGPNGGVFGLYFDRDGVFDERK